MGGFTRPGDLRASNWFPGGRYLSLSKAYESPSPAAYEPHTVFVLESRLKVHYGRGRVDANHHLIGVCRESDLEAILERYNSDRAPLEAMQCMDNARWPWYPANEMSPIKWWETDEEWIETISMLRGVSLEEAAKELPIQWWKTDSEKEAAEILKREAEALEKRLEKERASFAKQVSGQDFGDISAATSSRRGKVPVEVQHPDGTYHHASGFKPPTPAENFKNEPAAPAVAAPTKSSARVDVHSDSVHDLENWNKIREAKKDELMPNLTAGILTGFVTATTEPRNAKIPTEVVGVVDGTETQPPQHASGFIPPTPALDRGDEIAQTTDITPEEEPEEISFHDDMDIEGAPEVPSDSWIFPAGDPAARARFLPLLKDDPFWRPLIAVTVSTRPIALSLVRLARGMSRGVPYHSVITPEDRKCRVSYNDRMRCIRLNRMQELCTNIAQILAGARGGPVGIRFAVDEPGRGIGGKELESPIPYEKRVLQIGVANWYDRASLTKSEFKALGKEQVADLYEFDEEGRKKGPFVVYGLDEKGRRIDDETGEVIPWPKHPKDVAGEAVHRETSQLRAILAADKGEGGDNLYVKVPVNYNPQKDVLEFVDHNTVAEAGFVVHYGTAARAVIRQRTEYLHARHKELLAQRRASRVHAVEYPTPSF